MPPLQQQLRCPRLYESASLQFRIDMINAAHPPRVYGGSGTNSNPVTDWTSATFGQVSAQENQPRIYQFEAFIRF